MTNEPVGPYGTEAEAREYAEDIGAVYCPACMTVFDPQPGLPNDGHDNCPGHHDGHESGVK